jgi:hypothetical protein
MRHVSDKDPKANDSALFDNAFELIRREARALLNDTNNPGGALIVGMGYNDNLGSARVAMIVNHSDRRPTPVDFDSRPQVQFHFDVAKKEMLCGFVLPGEVEKSAIDASVNGVDVPGVSYLISKDPWAEEIAQWIVNCKPPKELLS